MLALAPQEDLEMRLHIKCSGSTKKFGKGIFAVTNQRMLYDSYDDGLCFSHPINQIDSIKRVGNHEFCLQWYEDKRPYFFQAKIEKHYGWKPTAQDLFDRWIETLAGYDPRGYDGWRCNIYGVIYNVYMPEYNENIRMGEFTPEMEDAMKGIKDWANKWTIKIGKGTIDLDLYAAITRLWHKKEYKTAVSLSGETYEDQRLIRKCIKHMALSYDRNYHSFCGKLAQQGIDFHFNNFIGYVRKDLSFYEGMVQRAKDGLKAAGSDKVALNAKRNYSDYAKPFKDMYKYADENGAWMWISGLAKNHKKHVREPLEFTGTPGQFLTRMSNEYRIRKRTRDIMEAEYVNFEWIKNFWVRAYEVHNAIKERLNKNMDIDIYVPPASFKPSMLTAEAKIKQYESRLQEPF